MVIFQMIYSCSTCPLGFLIVGIRSIKSYVDVVVIIYLFFTYRGFLGMMLKSYLTSYNHQIGICMKFDNNGLLDDINLEIINVLSKDSSVPFVEIAKQIGISDATVHLRVRRLKDEGVINKFRLSIDNDLLGYDHLSFIGINIRPGLADQITGIIKYRGSTGST
jgi:Winged helix-turn-helix DNA-binding